MQLVGAGFGCTLVPALSISSSWATGSGVILREIKAGKARRRIRLLTRETFPHQADLQALARLILEKLPNTVLPLNP